MKQKIKKLLQFITNPKFLLCFGIAWIITNGWSYIMFAAGKIFDITWMQTVALAYIAFLWLPMTPEKIVTCAIAIALLRWLFPDDQKTLAVLKEINRKAKEAAHSHKEKKNAAKQAKQEATEPSASDNSEQPT